MLSLICPLLLESFMPQSQCKTIQNWDWDVSKMKLNRKTRDSALKRGEIWGIGSAPGKILLGLTLEDDSRRNVGFYDLFRELKAVPGMKPAKKSIYWPLFPNVGGYQGGAALPSSGVLAMEFKDLHTVTG